VFDGWCAAQGVDPLELPIDRLCNLTYWFLVRNADEKRRAEIDARLEDVPAGEDLEGVESAWSAEAEMAAFTQASRAASSAAT